MVSGLMDFNRYGAITSQPLQAAEIRDLVSAAHDAGFAVMVHANGADTVRAALLAGRTASSTAAIRIRNACTCWRNPTRYGFPPSSPSGISAAAGAMIPRQWNAFWKCSCKT